MPRERLRWSYLCELLRRSGEAYVVLDSYLLLPQSLQGGLVNRLRQCWWIRLLKESLQVVTSASLPKVIAASMRTTEGDHDMAEFEIRLGRLLGLTKLRSRYKLYRRDVANARWRTGVLNLTANQTLRKTNVSMNYVIEAL
jgi:hypothetical protein